ncbi:MAG: hypothetical protein ACJAZX_000364 [Rickettsiales bacterium]
MELHKARVYNFDSEPNSVVTVLYQVLNDESTSRSVGEFKFINLAFKDNYTLLEFDSQGRGELLLNPSVFIRDYIYDKYNIAYNLTLMN